MTNILSNLTPAAGSTKKRKRIGRGQGSGHGGTATKGHKGAKSRSGYKSKLYFEGGQMPLSRRVPKFGFKPIHRVEPQIINLETLETLVGEKKIASVVNPELLYKIGVISKKHQLLKVLGDGLLTAKLQVSAHAFSKRALEKIQAVGGTATLLTRAPSESAKK
jgi:large subunit ribosomal protein L15